MNAGCCKCGCERIAGPRYERPNKLRYACTQCRFTWTTPSLDAMRRPVTWADIEREYKAALKEGAA